MEQLKTLNFILIKTPIMISIKILAIFLLFFLALAQNDPKLSPAESDVIILNNENFESEVLQSEDAWMIDFYAPWCGHCIKMSAQWDKFATKMKGSIKVAKIDAAENSKYNDAYGLKGFPHIVFIPAGKKDQSNYFTHAGTRIAQAFEKWVMQKLDEIKRSQLERLTDEQKWTEVCLGPHSDFCTIFFLPNITNSSQEQHEFYLKTIQGLTKKFSRQPISWLWAQDGDHKGLQQLFGLEKSFPYIVLINPSGRRFAVMQKPFTEDDFTEWFKNVWDIEFKQYEGKLPFGDQMPLPSTSQTRQQL